MFLHTRAASVGLAAMLWSTGCDEVTVIDFPDSSVTLASRLNDEARVVGFFSEVDMTLPITSSSGFIWDQGEFTRIDVPDAVPGTTVSTDINNDTKVVGTYLSQEQRSTGFLREPDGTFTPIDFEIADDGVGVFDINDHEQIVGIYATVVDDGDG
jgi:hypothetical protein